MDKSLIHVGHEYLLRHSGALCTVRVLAILPTAPGSKRVHYSCLKLSTNREIRIKSAMKFKAPVVNRKEGT